LEEGVGAAISQAQPGDACSGVGDDGVVEGVEGFGGADRVVAESLDAQQAPVGGEADLPQCGQMCQPFPDRKITDFRAGIGVPEGILGLIRKAWTLYRWDTRPARRP
jgi:hypothetical protein